MRFLFLLLLSCSLHAQNVLITGGTGSIGSAMVQSFHEKGWKVWIGCRENTIVPMIYEEKIRYIPMEMENEEMIQRGVAHIIEEDGHLDCVVNNVSYGIIGADECVPLDEVKKLFDVNFFGPLRVVNAVAPHMRAQNHGHIINISSTSGVRAVPGLGHYAASKFALEGWSESLAITLSPWNIRVTLVEPGTMKNDWAMRCQTFGSLDPLYKKVADNLLTKLVALAENGQACKEISDLVVYIAEQENPDMRYQTSLSVKKRLGLKLQELSGNRMRELMKQFYRTLQ
ncbi:MAG: SDR family oxidoreductase [Chlamydiales bacterium]